MEHKIKYFYYYIIISLLLVNQIFTIYPEINFQNRFLDIENGSINENLNNSNITANETSEGTIEDNPYIYFLGCYVLFIFLGLYFIALLKRTNNTQLINKINDVWFFLYFANNGALLISLFSLTIIIDRYGTSIIFLSIAICLVGTLIYICKTKDQR